jgi:hypothetical protein
MKAQLLTRIDKIENHPLVYTTVEDPQPEPDEVLIKIKACGVCYSNLSMIEGEFKELFGIPSKLPVIPGHEITVSLRNWAVQQLGSRKATGLVFRCFGKLTECASFASLEEKTYA